MEYKRFSDLAERYPGFGTFVYHRYSAPNLKDPQQKMQRFYTFVSKEVDSARECEFSLDRLWARPRIETIHILNSDIRKVVKFIEYAVVYRINNDPAHRFKTAIRSPGDASAGEIIDHIICHVGPTDVVWVDAVIQMTRKCFVPSNQSSVSFEVALLKQ